MLILMKNTLVNNSVNDGMIISTTGFPKNSHPQEFIISWHKGSEKIVGMTEKLLEKTSTQKTFIKQTPFIPQYVFSFSDEQSMLSHKQPMKLFWAAQEYQDWIMNDCKGKIPEFKEVVDTLCIGRLSLMIGLGGYIFCEFNVDSDTLCHYYQV